MVTDVLQPDNTSKNVCAMNDGKAEAVGPDTETGK